MAITDANLDPVAVNDPHPDAHNEERKAILDILEFLENDDGGGAPIEPPLDFVIEDEDVLVAEPSTSVNSIFVYGGGRLILPETGVPGERYRFLVYYPRYLNIFTNEEYWDEEDPEEPVMTQENPGWSQVWVEGAPSGSISAADVVYFLDPVDPEDPEAIVRGHWYWTWMQVDDGLGGDTINEVREYILIEGYSAFPEDPESEDSYIVGEPGMLNAGWGPRKDSREYFVVALEIYHQYTKVRIEGIQYNEPEPGSLYGSDMVDARVICDIFTGPMPFEAFRVQQQTIPTMVVGPGPTHIGVDKVGFATFGLFSGVNIQNVEDGMVLGVSGLPIKLTQDHDPAQNPG